MAVTPSRVRELALALTGASEVPHMERMAFRTPRKIFATLAASGEDLNLMLDQDLRDFYSEHARRAFHPVPGGWGRMGITTCLLTEVDEPTLHSALAAAHRLAAPRPRRPSRFPSGRPPG
jgi:hypothetical protein